MRRSGYRHRTALKRLAQDVERILAVFRQFVEKQHAPVGQRNFAGPGIRPAADQRHIGHRMMRLAERPLRNQPLAAEHPRHAVNFGHFQRLVRLEGREYGRNALGEHSLAASGRADEQQVVDLADDQRRKDGDPFRCVQEPGQPQESVQKFRAARPQADTAVWAGRGRGGIGHVLDHLAGQAPVQLQRHGQERMLTAGLEDAEGVGHVDTRDQALSFSVMDLPVPQHGDLFSLHDDGC